MNSLLETPRAVPIRYYFADGEEAEARDLHLGDGTLVQFGNGQPKQTYELTEDELSALLTEQCAVRSTYELEYISDYIHGIICEWTDEEIAERLGMHPGDVPIFRTHSWFVTVEHVAIASSLRGIKVGDLWREAGTALEAQGGVS